MKNKKSVMTFAAMQILIFHLWIFMFPGNPIEKFLKETSYFGVDVFFFISAYSLANRDVEKHWKFIAQRFSSVYIKFILLCICLFFYKSQKLRTLIFNICGANLFIKGGSSFLWFAPAIMIMYIFMPVLQKAYKKNARFTGVIVVSAWAIAGLIVTNFTSYKAMFIFFNRIPVIITGFYMAKSTRVKMVMQDTKLSLICGGALLFLGEILVYEFAYNSRLINPICDMFYVMVIPATIGVVFIVSQIPENKVIKLIGSSTLEMYGLQMIFGYTIANEMLKRKVSNGVVNLLTIAVLILLSVAVSKLYEFIVKMIKERIDKRLLFRLK